MISIFILSIVGLFSMIAGLFRANKTLIIATASLSMVISALFTSNILSVDIPSLDVLFNQMLQFDSFSAGFGLAILVVTCMVLLLSELHVQQNPHYVTDKVALMVFSLIGMLVLVSFNHMAMLFLGIEIMSIPLYILAGSKKADVSSNESSLKYFLMGAFATGLLLMGITLIYGETGAFHLHLISDFIKNHSITETPMLAVGILFLLAGLSFKVSLFPFHFWTPDVYQGAPTWITQFMSTSVKLAGFAAFYRLFIYAFYAYSSLWIPILAAIAAFTIAVGSITALFQLSVKRILAYSGVTNAGFMVIALILNTHDAANTLLFYGFAYVIASTVAFAVVQAVEHSTGNNQIDSFNGLAQANPMLAVAMLISMLSLAGIPLTGGFFAKFYVVSNTIESGFTWLAVLAIISAIVGMYYYFKIIIAMFFKDLPANSPLELISVGGVFTYVLVICCILVLQMGLFPDFLYHLF